MDIALFLLFSPVERRRREQRSTTGSSSFQKSFQIVMQIIARRERSVPWSPNPLQRLRLECWAWGRLGLRRPGHRCQAVLTDTHAHHPPGVKEGSCQGLRLHPGAAPRPTSACRRSSRRPSGCRWTMSPAATGEPQGCEGRDRGAQEPRTQRTSSGCLSPMSGRSELKNPERRARAQLQQHNLGDGGRRAPGSDNAHRGGGAAPGPPPSPSPASSTERDRRPSPSCFFIVDF